MLNSVNRTVRELGSEKIEGGNQVIDLCKLVIIFPKIDVYKYYIYIFFMKKEIQGKIFSIFVSIASMP